MALLLTHDDVSGLLSMGEAIAAVRAGFRQQGDGRVRLPSRLTSDTGAGWLRLMPASLEGSGYMGFKAMHLTRGVGVRYMVALFELSSGVLLALVDADRLTVMRTAATTAVAATHLARPGPLRVGVLGSGEQARAHLLALAQVCRLAGAAVYSPRPERRRAFSLSLGRELDLPVEAVDHPEDAVDGAQAVVIAVRAAGEPLFRAAWLQPGMHVSGISSVRPEAREIEDAVWRGSDLVVVDDRQHVLESGDGRAALASGSLRPEQAVELWELVCGRHPGRRRPEEVTLFKSVGTAVQDLALAAALYERARERGAGADVGEFPHVRS